MWAPACGGDGEESASPEEQVELARSRADAPDFLRARLVAADSSLSVRLRAMRGLVEMGRIDQLRHGLRELPIEQATRLVETLVPNLTWLAMAGSVPEGRLRQPQIFAKDALLLLEEWMSPGVRRETRAVAVRWFAADLPQRAGSGDMPLARCDPAVRNAVAAVVSLRTARRWSDYPALTQATLQLGTDADRLRLREEAAELFRTAPFDTPEQRAETRAGVLAALRGLSGDAAALKVALGGRTPVNPDNALLADLTALRDALAAEVRDPTREFRPRSVALARLQELGFALRPLGLGVPAADEDTPAALRAELVEPLTREGDGAAAAAAALATAPEIFAAAAPALRFVKIQGEILVFARALAAAAPRLAGLPGRCDAVVEALAGMAPRRSASAAILLLESGDPVIMAFGVEVLARVGTPDHTSALAALRTSGQRSACWPDRTLADLATRALEAISSRGATPIAVEAGDDDGG
ncbi:MAG: hypothetical protein JXB32_19665 [Deltaproteobacteria bacterium]|nr:hypothetical protein [Deltaproteobacteria bacterium]